MGSIYAKVILFSSSSSSFSPSFPSSLSYYSLLFLIIMCMSKLCILVTVDTNMHFRKKKSEICVNVNMASGIVRILNGLRNEGNTLFNDVLNIFTVI